MSLRPLFFLSLRLFFLSLRLLFFVTHDPSPGPVVGLHVRPQNSAKILKRDLLWNAHPPRGLELTVAMLSSLKQNKFMSSSFLQRGLQGLQKELTEKRAEKIGREIDRCTEHEAARVKINDEEAQLKRMRVNAECATLCGAEGCGRGNQGQFESPNHAAMRQHCGTQKHKVLNSAKCHFFDVYSSLMFTLCCKQNNGGISMGGTIAGQLKASCGVKDSGKEESCGAEGKGNSGQYKTTEHAAMLKHWETKKHKVFYFAQFVVVVMFAKLVCLSVFNRTTLRLQLEELQHRAIQEPANLQSKQRNLTNAIRRLQP